jgi:cytochrome b involved in lipid metabolism
LGSQLYVASTAEVTVSDASQLAYSTRPILTESRVDVEKEQLEDPDGVVSGAKGSKKQGVISHVDPVEDFRAVHGPGEYLTLKEVARHNLAQDAWVVVEGKVFE